MPDYSKMSYGEISKLLADAGSTIGEFNQGDYRTEVGQRVTPKGIATRATFGGKSLGSGYCAGVCLDWARRVLLSPQTRNASFLTYGYEKIRKGQGTRDGRTVEQSKDRAFQTVGRMARAWDASKTMNWTAPHGTEDYTMKETTWANKAASLDSAFNSDRSEDGRAATSKPFASMVVLGSKSSTFTSASQWMGALLSNGLVAGAVSKFGFRVPGSSGHAIAVWQRKTSVNDADSFYLFDPNFGVFSYQKEKLQLAIQYLFWQDGSDIPYYDTCASATNQEMDYITFGPPNLVSALPGSVTSPVGPLPKTTPTTTAKPPTTGTEPASAKPPSTVTPPTTPKPPTSAPVTATGPSNGYSQPAISVPLPGVVSPKATVPTPTGQGKNAQLIAELQALKATGKILDSWGPISYTSLGGLLVLREPLKKKILAAKPGAQLRTHGVQSGIDVKYLNGLIESLGQG